jgi:uncharacterized protein YcnI
MWFVALGVVLLVTAADAHVRIAPLESTRGATQTYTARVPTEGKVSTTSVQLDVPDDVTIVSATAPAGTHYNLKRDGQRTIAIIWTVDIKPGDVAELSFVARNPAEGQQITWHVHQRYADGTSSEWIGAAGTRQPAPVTKLTLATQ